MIHRDKNTLVGLKLDFGELGFGARQAGLFVRELRFFLAGRFVT